MIDIPSFRSYGQYSSDNYGAHTLVFTMGSTSVWFSYETPVAFNHPNTGFVIRENEWGPTTGKHLNWIDDDHSRRVGRQRFYELWEKAQQEP